MLIYSRKLSGKLAGSISTKMEDLGILELYYLLACIYTYPQYN